MYMLLKCLHLIPRIYIDKYIGLKTKLKVLLKNCIRCSLSYLILQLHMLDKNLQGLLSLDKYAYLYVHQRHD